MAVFLSTSPVTREEAQAVLTSRVSSRLEEVGTEDLCERAEREMQWIADRDMGNLVFPERWIYLSGPLALPCYVRHKESALRRGTVAAPKFPHPCRNLKEPVVPLKSHLPVPGVIFLAKVLFGTGSL